MTPTRYYVARLAQAFGYVRRSQRMADAASEMHLLREAEAQLGAMIWEKAHDIDVLSVEYWNLRKLVKERQLLDSRLAECQEKVAKAHEQRAAILNSAPEANQELLEKRATLLAGLEQLANERDRVIQGAREIRRSHVGMKMKLEVLTKEGGGSAEAAAEIEKVKQRLEELHSRFAELKQERQRIGGLIEEGDAKADELESRIREEKQKLRTQAAEAFEMIGEGNKELALLRAEVGLLDMQLRQLQGEIGRYVSRNTRTDAACARAAASHMGLVEVMRALRRSVVLNHRLAGVTG
jgi:chromosome segregation ATPase